MFTINFNAPQLTEVLLGQVSILFDPEQWEKSLLTLSKNERNEFLTTKLPEGETLLDLMICRIQNETADSEVIFNCLIFYLKHLDPIDKAPLLNSPNTFLWKLWHLAGCLMKNNRFDKAEILTSTLLEGLDIEVRKQIASVKNSQNTTIIHLAACNNAYLLISGLLKDFTEEDLMAVFSIRDSKVRTPLHMAVCASPLVWDALLNGLSAVKKEELIALQEQFGLSVLHFSQRVGKLQSTNILIASSPRVIDLQDSKGNTILHVAKKIGLSSILYCLEKGANPYIVNADGERALSDDAIKRWEITKAKWSRLKLTYLADEVVELQSNPWNKRKMKALILFPMYDPNQGFSITYYPYVTHITKLEGNYNILLQKVNCQERAILAFTRIEGELDYLGIGGHSLVWNGSRMVVFGSKKETMRGLTPVFSVADQLFLEIIVKKMAKNGVVAFYTCNLGRSEQTISLPEKLALLFEGTVIASSEEILPEYSFCSDFLDYPLCDFPVRFRTVNGVDSTVLFTKESVREKWMHNASAEEEGVSALNKASAI